MPDSPNLQMFRLSWLRERLSTSLWVWPTSAVGLAILAGFLLPQLDAWASHHGWFTFDGKADSARALLTTVATSMLTITGVVFSITILVLQLASSQFSPRVLRTFLQDPTTQASMSVFLGSFVYALVVLAQIRADSTESRAFVPGGSVYAAFVLAIAGSLMLVRYIHHMAHSIRPAVVLRRIADEARSVIAVEFPHALSPNEPRETGPDTAPNVVLEHVGGSGILAGVDVEALFQLARARDLTIALVPQIGTFVPRGGELLRIWGDAPGDAAQAFHACVVIGADRTPRQDPAFGFRQLTDIAERALSPGINDPTTAVQALDHAHDLLRMLASRELGPLVIRERGQARIIVPRPEWSTFVRLSLDEIRHYGRSSIQIANRIGLLLKDVARIAPAERKAALDEQLRLLRASVRQSFADPSDCVLAESGLGPEPRENAGTPEPGAARDPSAQHSRASPGIKTAGTADHR